MKFLNPTILSVILLLFSTLYTSSQTDLAVYEFTGDSPEATAAENGINASAMNISSASITYGTVNSADWTGSGVPYAQGSSGWGAASFSAGKFFSFTLTADALHLFNASGINFLYRATGAGPSALTVTVNNIEISTINVVDNQTLSYSESLSFDSLDTVEVKIIGWDNGSRATSGGGQFRIDDVTLEGETIPRTRVIDFNDNAKWTAGSSLISSYDVDHVYEDMGMTFTGGEALRQTSSSQDGFPGALGDYSWRLRDASTVEWIGTLNLSGEIQQFGFKVRRWSDSPSPDFNVSYSTDGGGSYTPVTTIDNAFLNDSSDWTHFTHSLSPAVQVDHGDFIVKFEAGGTTERIMIDDFEYTLDDNDAGGWKISSTDALFEIDFDATVQGVNRGQFNGSGFSPAPASGQLNSRSWAVTGMSDGDVTFNDLRTSNDFARGISNGTAGTGGIYAYEISSGNHALGIKPGSSDWAPGTLTLRVSNTTGSPINDVIMTYTVYNYNDQNRANSFDFQYSEDGASYTSVNDVDYTSVEAASGTPEWSKNRRTVHLTGLDWEDGEFLYLRWNGDDISGSGSRDAFALDDIQLIAEPNAQNLSGISGNYESAVAGTNETLTSNVTIDRYFRVMSGTEVEITSDFNLHVEDEIVNNGVITVKNNASLTQSGSSDNNSGSGMYNIERAGTDKLLELNAWSSPVQDVIIHDDPDAVFGDANPCDILAFDGSDQWWKYDYTTDYQADCGAGTVTFTSNYLIPGADGVMNSARGYFAPGDGTAARTFTGNAIHNGDISYNLEAGTNPSHASWTGDNWNLIGNPYPSAIDIVQFLTANISELNTAAVYIWVDDGSEGSTYSPADYISVNSSGSSVSPPHDPGFSKGNIPSCQGFFIQGTGNVTFTNSMRAIGDNDEFRSGRGDSDDQFKFWLSLGNDSLFSDILIAFVPDATSEFDKRYDAPRMFGQESLSMAGRLNTGEEMSIMGVPPLIRGDTQIIPLTVKTDTALKRLFISFMINDESAVEFFLLDRKTADTVNLRIGEHFFKFDSAGTDTSRFELMMFSPAAPPIDDEDTVSIGDRVDHDEIKIYVRESELIGETRKNPMTGIILTDMGGRIIKDESRLNTKRHALDISGLSAGIYIVRISRADKTTAVRKVMIK